MMDIQTRTRSARPSRRFDLLVSQWERKRFEQHRNRVKTAGPRIDDSQPASAMYTHVQVRTIDDYVHDNVNNVDDDSMRMRLVFMMVVVMLLLLLMITLLLLMMMTMMTMMMVLMLLLLMMMTMTMTMTMT